MVRRLFLTTSPAAPSRTTLRTRAGVLIAGTALAGTTVIGSVAPAGAALSGVQMYEVGLTAEAPPGFLDLLPGWMETAQQQHEQFEKHLAEFLETIGWADKTVPQLLEELHFNPGVGEMLHWLSNTFGTDATVTDLLDKIPVGVFPTIFLGDQTIADLLLTPFDLTGHSSVGDILDLLGVGDSSLDELLGVLGVDDGMDTTLIELLGMFDVNGEPASDLTISELVELVKPGFDLTDTTTLAQLLDGFGIDLGPTGTIWQVLSVLTGGLVPGPNDTVDSFLGLLGVNVGSTVEQILNSIDLEDNQGTLADQNLSQLLGLVGFDDVDGDTTLNGLLHQIDFIGDKPLDELTIDDMLGMIALNDDVTVSASMTFDEFAEAVLDGDPTLLSLLPGDIGPDSDLVDVLVGMDPDLETEPLVDVLGLP